MTNKPTRKRTTTNTAYLRFIATFIAVTLAVQMIYALQIGWLLVLASVGVSVVMIAVMKVFERYTE